ncbi:hypothetical protein NCU01910 [Neurospora crassa OR74A]|uniref:Uncharacterized protein n=1 Tax=Neurospora crassa (strain ATCC 24698 / 74-OR23-1A / CBS 708.71 / DSM 1257 / FGSC 987) TaxID=367110 RepID=Q7SH96_NEUCR|nr:hypothetical protein NCU01910 [Neurospora crassa OR74A]EAA36305.2 hypothetical protein NCU01910 [Neurospora crassa OR74A]|eukprot:XP_965541.2 hypothetical protein NCU01910 [Neurospora crassa OR74A]
MEAHAQAAHNGQYYSQSARTEPQQVYSHPHQPRYQQHQHQQQSYAPQLHFQSQSTSRPQPQPDGANLPNRHPSFIGLPPISRTSTFSSLLGPFQVEGSADDNNSTYSDADITPRNLIHYQQGQQGGQQTVVTTPQTVSESISMAANQTGDGVPPHGQVMPQTPPPGQIIPNMYRPTQGPAQGQMQIQGQPLPNGFPSPPGAGSVPGQSPVQAQSGEPGPPGNAQGQPASALAGPPGAPLSVMNGGTPPAAPQFTPANGRPVMIPPPHLAGRFPQGNWNLQESHLSEPLQPTNRHRHSSSNASQQPFYGFDKETGVPASPRSQRAPDTEQQPHMQPVDQNSQGPQLNGQENPRNPIEQRPGGNSSQTNTDVDDLPAPRPIPAADGNKTRRNSGIFSSLRNRVGAGTPVTSDAVSDASVMTDETGGQQQRRTQMISALGAGAATEAPQSKESIMAHGSTTPVNGGLQSPPPQHQQQQPKKSRMGLKAMFSRSSQQDGSRPSGSAQPARPTTQGQVQSQHHVQQPVAASGANPMYPLRPKTSGQVLPQQHQTLASISESEKARKPSGGIFGMFKNKDTKPGSGTGAGQPLMDPRQTLQGMGRGQMPMPPPGQGQFSQQQYRQQFPVGPDGKLVIFPGQLPPQHQQFMQQGHPGMYQPQQIQMQWQIPEQDRPHVNMQQSRPSVQGQNGGPQDQPQQQHQQQLDARKGQSNGQNAVSVVPVSPPVASPVPSDSQSATHQSRPQQNTPPATNGQAPPAATNGGHARTLSQGSNLPNMYTLGMNGIQPDQLPARKPVGSRVVSAQIPSSLLPQQQRQRGASVSSTPPPQPQSLPSTQFPSSLGTQRPVDSQHTLASQGGMSLPDVPAFNQRADEERFGTQDQQNQGLGRQQKPQHMPAGLQGSQSLVQGTLNQNIPFAGHSLSHEATTGPGFPVQQEQQPPQRLPPPSPGFPPRNVMTIAPPPKEKEQSTISKLFRGTKQQTSPTTSQEKGKSSFMSALKRGGNSKQGDAQPRSPAQSPQVNQGQFQPNQAQIREQAQRPQGLQPPQTQFPGQPQQQPQQKSPSGLRERRPSPHLQYQNERQDPSKAPSPPVQVDLAMRLPAQQPSQQPTRPSATSAPGVPDKPRPAPQMFEQQTQQPLTHGEPNPAPGLVQGQRPPIPGQPLHPSQMAGQAQAQAFAEQQFFQAQAQVHAHAQMFQRFQQQQHQQQQQQAQFAAQVSRPDQPPIQGQGQGQNPPTSAPPGQEPWYAQMPIPAGYFPVHQGMAQTSSPMGMPMSYFINVPGQPPQGYFMPMPGQVVPPGMPGMPHMLPPGFVPGQPFVYAPHPGGPMPPRAPPGSVPATTPPSTGGTPFFTPPASHGGPQQMFHVPVHPSSPPPGSEHSVQHPPSISPTPPPFIGTSRQASDLSPQPQMQFQQPTQPSPSPPKCPLPNTPFSPVNPDAVNVPNPPLPPSETQVQQPQQQPNPGLIPQRQVSQVSAMSMQPSNGSPSTNVISPISADSGVTQVPEGGGQEQLSRSGSAALPRDSKTIVPEPVNVAQKFLDPGIDEDCNGDKNSKKGENDDHHSWNGITTDGDSRAVSPEPLLYEHGPMTPPPTTVSFIRAQAQEVHVHRSPDRHVGDGNIYDATPRQSIKSPVLLPRRDSMEEENETDLQKTEDETFTASEKRVDGLGNIRDESPANGNSHFIVAPVSGGGNEINKLAEPTPAHQAPYEARDVDHGKAVGVEDNEKEEPVIPGHVEHNEPQQQSHIADVTIVPADETAQSPEPTKDAVDQQQPQQHQPLQPQPQQGAALPSASPPAPAPVPAPAPAPQQQSIIIISPEPSPSQSPEPSKPQLHQPQSTENGAITTASGFLISSYPSSNHTDPSNPKGILKPLTDRSIFEEAKRKQLLREQEEKIPVFSDDDDYMMKQNNGTVGAAGTGNKKKEDEDAVPMMSATSYPGQEWNPYELGMGGDGGEGWED